MGVRGRAGHGVRGDEQTSNAAPAGSPPREQRNGEVGALPVTACMLPVTACISMFVAQPSKFPWKFLETENGRAWKFPKERAPGHGVRGNAAS